MTAQITDTLLHEGQSYAMYATPLSDYFAMSGIDLQLRGDMSCNWRGYVARWETVGGRLYLVQVDSHLAVGELRMRDVFPHFPDRVFAHWYTGDLRLPHGPQLEYVHAGFASIYTYELVLDIEQGVVRGQRLVDNRPAPPPGLWDRIRGLRRDMSRFFGGAA